MISIIFCNINAIGKSSRFYIGSTKFLNVFIFIDKAVIECGKFRRWCVIVDLVGLVPSYHHMFLAISWIRNFFLWLFLGLETLSDMEFLRPKFFLVGILWDKIFFAWVFGGSKIFLSWVFCGSDFFSSWLFSRSKFFLSWLISWFKDFHLLAVWERVIKSWNT